MKQKIISMLMAMVVLLTTVDLSVFASETTVSGNEVQSVIEEANDDVETTGELETENENVKDKTVEENVRFEEKIVEKEEKVSSNSVVSVTSIVTESGQCGEKLNWEIEGDTLTISGTGDTWNYELATGAPWYNSRMNLKNLVIEEGTTSIGDWAFHDCEFFSGNLVIPDSVVHIGKGAFSGCKGFTGNLILPEKLESIGANAFWSCMRLKGDLIIPEGVTRIEPSTFYACYDLNGKLVLPENLTFVGSQAFSSCENLIGDLTIPSNVSVIEEYAFVGCSSLDGSLTLPESIEKIGFSAFGGCEKLTGSLILPKKITEIGSSTFSGCSGITGSVTIPQNVTFIGDSAFKDCSGITEFIIEGDISNIANMAFSNCSSVSTIKFLGEVQWINRAFAGVTANVYYSSKKSDWSKIINSDLGGTLTWIPYNEDAENETVSGQCGDNLTWKIEDDTFIVSGTGDMWDYGWTETPPWHQYIDGMQLKLEIQDGVNSIGSSAFMCNCKFIGSLEIPDSVTKIGDAAFYGCEEFTGNLIIPSSVSEIGESAFFACSGFTGSLEIPDGVTIIKPRAFGGCSGLTGDLEIPDSVTEIGGEAFVLCGFIGNLRIPASVTTINFSAFAGCSGLTGNLKIPDSVTFIGNGAFKDCSGFTGDLNLSEYVVWIGESAFAECSGLSGTAYIRGELENIGENAFTTITKIYGRAGTLVETYAKNNNIIFEELDDLSIQEIVKVETASDLMKISDNVSKGVTDYKGQTIEITQDIDLSSETWIPIGNTSRPFRGNIQGNGYTISGIRCNDVYGGLIGCWASQESSYIDNLIVDDIYLTGKRSGGIVANLWVDENDQADISNVTVKGTINGISLISGGVVGAISGNGKVQISGCNIDVSMYSGPIYNDNYGCIGGVVGSATDSGSGELIISSCIVNGNITTEQTYSYCSSEAGGIIGLSKVKTLKIEQCSKKGLVSCKAYYAHTGGFIGSAEIRSDSSLIISDSYVNADITSTCTNGNSQCGGFIGHTSGTGGNPIKITNSYVTGSMNADNKAAFVCWYSEYVCPVVQNCYFDMAKLGLSKNHMVCRLTTFSKDWLSDNITNSGGLSTLEMKIVDNYAKWDFDNVWGMPAVFNEGYPALKGEDFEEKDNEEFVSQETIVDIVKKYVSGEEIKVLSEILNNPTLSDEAKVDKLSSYFHYDNVFDMREHITQLNNTHKERQGYEGLICDELYLSWQYYYYLNHTPKGTAARIALAASGLVFNGEVNDLIDPGTYMDGDYPGVQKYKTLLEQFIQRESTSIEAWSYTKEAERFISSLTDVCTETEKAQVIKQLRKAPSLVECESIFNDFIAAKVDKDTILEFKGEKPLFIEAMGYTDTHIKIIDMYMNAFSDLLVISSNIATYEMYHKFLQDIIDSSDLPWEMVVAAHKLDRELQQAYWTPIEKVLIEMRDVCLGEVFDAVKFKNILDKNGFLTAVNFSAFCINQLVDVGELVVNSCHTEGYAFLAMHYKNKLINSKNKFIEFPTEATAWEFYEAYVMLWKLRLAGEEKFLEMSTLEGGTVVDGISEAFTGGTIAGLLSECCGYADKKQAVEKNKKMLEDLKFSYVKKSTGIPQEYKYLQKIVVECPVNVEFSDADNNVICRLEDKVEQTIENEHGKFMAVYSVASGDYVKIAYLKKNIPYQVRIVGQESGKVTYNIAKTNDHVDYSLEGFDNIVVDKNSIIQTKTDTSLYTIDLEGDGEINQEREHIDKKKIYVQFDYQDGQKVLVEYVDENGFVEIPEEPVREDYIFEGWFIDITDIESKFATNMEINESITVYAKWKEKTKLSVPSSNIASDSVVKKGTEIVLSCETEGVQIYYTLDGSNPTTASTLYTNPIVLTEATTIKAMAVKEGFHNSGVSVFTYTLKISEDNSNEDDKKEDETLEEFTVIFNSNGGSEVPKQTVEENQKAKKPGNPVYEGYVFKGWYLGDKLYDFEKPVTADITLKAKWEKKEIGKETLSSPTANIVSGSVVEKGTEIVLSCETEGVQIYYTLDGSNPTTGSSLYTTPIVLTEETIIKAMAVKEGFNNSGVSVFAYTLKISEDSLNEDDKKEDKTLEDNKQEGENIGEKVESENNNDNVFNVQLGESKRDELEYNKFSLKENKKIKDTFAPYIKENNDDILNEIADVSDETDENNEQNVYNEESSDDITTDMGEIEEDTSADTEKNGLGAVAMGVIIIGLGVVFIYGRNKRHKD